MKQLFRMFIIDLKTSMKSFMSVYIAIVPMVILIVLRSFLPSVESTSVNIAIVTDGPNAVEQEIFDALDSFTDVTSYDSIEAMERKLRGSGSAEGLYWDPEANQYVSVLERARESNTVFSVAARVIRQHTYWSGNAGAPSITSYTYGVPPELSDRTKTSPVATVGGSIFITFMIIISGFIIGLNLVNDKEEGTVQAIRISPASKVDYFLGKSIYPLLVLLVYTVVGLLLLKLIQVDILQTYIVVVISYMVALLFGLVLGAIGNNENEAIGFGKLLSMVVALSILGGTLLPDGWQWAVWWSPVYWVYDVLEEVFTDSATWAVVGWKCAIVVGLTGAIFLLLRKRIIKGLS